MKTEGTTRIVFSRKAGETIVIGDNVRVCVVQTGKTVSLSIEAPRDVPVDRLEIRERKIQGVTM